MNTGQVKEMFKSYTDESDTTFLTDAQINLYLSEGYNDFRRAVCDIDPFIYSIDFLFTMPDTGTFDLKEAVTQPDGAAVRLLDKTKILPATAGKKLERLLRVARINDTINNQVIRYMDSSPSERNLNDFSYAFVNDKLITYSSGTLSYRLEYVPYHNVDFGVADDLIDHLEGFHGMIPLYAYSRYAIRDGGDNPQIRQEIMRRLADLKSYLESGRSREGSQYVTSYDYWY